MRVGMNAVKKGRKKKNKTWRQQEKRKRKERKGAQVRMYTIGARGTHP